MLFRSSDETIAQAKECMRAVVDSQHGTGHKILFDTAYSISGKTGTAVTALDNRGYNKGNKIYQSSFIGYFPSDKPMYTMAVVIQNNNKSKKYYGADVAGTVFKKVSDHIYRRFLTKTKPKPVVSDSSVYNYFGMKTDLKTIFSGTNISFQDSLSSGVWRTATLQSK